MKACTLRFAEASDLSWIDSMDKGASRKTLMRKIDAREIILAELENETIALLQFDLLWACKPFVSQVSVIEKCRRQGVGECLLEYLEKILAEQGYSFYLSSSMPDNRPGKQWHRKMGFEECGFLAGINPGGVGEIFYKKGL